MYKTISVRNKTYQQLHAIAKRLNRPKSQVIDDLIRDYIDRMELEEKMALKTFNNSVKRLSKRIRLPKGTQINTAALDDAIFFIRESEPKTRKIRTNRKTAGVNDS